MSAETVNTPEQSKRSQGTCAASLSGQQSISGQKACHTSAAPSVVGWMVKDLGKARIQIEQDKAERALPYSSRGLSMVFMRHVHDGSIVVGKWYTTAQLSSIVGMPPKNCSAVLCYHASIGNIERRRMSKSQPMEWRLKS